MFPAPASPVSSKAPVLFLAEVQALASKSGYAVPKRMSTGFDYNRLSLLLAVLEKRCGYFSEHWMPMSMSSAGCGWMNRLPTCRLRWRWFPT